MTMATTIAIPEALRTQHLHPHADQYAQLQRYGLVDDTRLDRLLDRLAGATAHTSLPAGVYSTVPAFSNTSASDANGNPGGDAGAYRAAIKAATAFTAVDYAWVPLDETPSNMERNSDVTLHLSATLASHDLNDLATQWTLSSLGRPESGAVGPASSSSSAATAGAAGTGSAGEAQSVRRKMRVNRLVGNVGREMTRSTYDESVALLRGMLYRPHFAYAKRGWAFATPGCWVLVYKVFDIAANAPPNSTLDLSTSHPLPSCADMHTIEIISKPPPPHVQLTHFVAHAEAEMRLVSQWIRGLGDTGVPDLATFREKIPYKVR